MEESKIKPEKQAIKSKFLELLEVNFGIIVGGIIEGRPLSFVVSTQKGYRIMMLCQSEFGVDFAMEPAVFLNMTVDEIVAKIFELQNMADPQDFETSKKIAIKANFIKLLKSEEPSLTDAMCTDEAKLSVDLGFDSINVMQIMVLCEKQFGINISSVDFQRFGLMTIDEIVGYIYEAQQKK